MKLKFKFNFSKLLKLLKVFKKPIFLIILISALVSFTVSGLSIAYFKSWLQKNTGQPDLFLETQSSESLQEGATSAKTVKSIPEVVKEVSPAVVSIIVSKYMPIIEEYYYNPFGEDSPFEIKIPGYRQKGEELKEISSKRRRTKRNWRGHGFHCFS